MLAEDADAEHEQEQQAQREHRLDQREGSVGQGEDLQRPADQRERGGADPERPAEQVGHQRRPQGPLGGRAARLDRLQRVAGLVATRGGERQGEAESDLPVHEWHHPAIRKALLIGSAAAAAAWWSPALAPIVPGVAGALGLPRRIDDPEGVALTFDDGPHPEGTPAVLEALDTADATATFFLCGEQVERDPALAGEIVAAGHTIALHGYRHRNMLRLAAPDLRGRPGARDRRDRGRGRACARDLYRPPYGIFSYPGLVEVSAGACGRCSGRAGATTGGRAAA